VSPYQKFLLDVTRLGTPGQTDDEGEWYTLVVNDPEELGQPRTTIGLRLKIAGTPGDLVIRQADAYNR
jgi:hypothetical protein